MAIVTYLMAKSFGKPMVAAAPCRAGAVSHAYAVYRAELGNLKRRRSRGQARRQRSFTTRPAHGCVASSPMIMAST